MGRRRVKPFADARQGPRSAEYTRDQSRRRRFVKTWLREHGEQVGPNVWRCECQVCRQTLTLPLPQWTADHIHPVALGGDESGPLQLACAHCQQKQASAIGNARNPRAQPRRRQSEPHPGAIQQGEST